MKKISLFIIILVSIEKIKAQSASGEVNSVNQIKIGLTPLIFNTYSVNYERAVGDYTGLSLGVKLQPSSGFPLKSILVPLLSDDDEETETTLNNLAFKHTAVTLEYKVYSAKKGYGQGFYWGPYYRYGNYSAAIPFYDYDDLAKPYRVEEFNYNSHSAGLFIGTEWNIGDRLVIDWQILGIHWGISKGKGQYKSTTALDKFDQDELKAIIDENELFNSYTILSINQFGAEVEINKPWYGIRSGISIGIKF